MGLLRYAVDKEGREQYYDYTAYGSLAQRGDDDGLYAYRHSRNNLLKKAFHYGHDEEIDYTYDAFGNLRSVTGQSYNPFRYNGEYMDAESGLIYLRNRYYDPHTGRFITEDPIKYGKNWYVYCSSNPVNRWDPLGYLDTGYDANGIWRNWDAERFGYGSAVYKMLVGLTTAYENASADEARSRIHQLAATLRVTDTTITDNILLNNSAGASGFGHNATLLLNASGQGFLFSFNPANESMPYSAGELRFSILSAEGVNLLKDGDGAVYREVTIFGNLRDEEYDRFVWNDITSEQGNAMFYKAADIFEFPGTYMITGYQCDNVTNEIFTAGNAGYYVWSTPNNTYHRYKEGRTHWGNRLAVWRGGKI